MGERLGTYASPGQFQQPQQQQQQYQQQQMPPSSFAFQPLQQQPQLSMMQPQQQQFQMDQQPLPALLPPPQPLFIPSIQLNSNSIPLPQTPSTTTQQHPPIVGDLLLLDTQDPFEIIPSSATTNPNSNIQSATQLLSTLSVSDTPTQPAPGNPFRRTSADPTPSIRPSGELPPPPSYEVIADPSNPFADIISPRDPPPNVLTTSSTQPLVDLRSVTPPFEGWTPSVPLTDPLPPPPIEDDEALARRLAQEEEDAAMARRLAGGSATASSNTSTSRRATTQEEEDAALARRLAESASSPNSSSNRRATAHIVEEDAKLARQLAAQDMNNRSKSTGDAPSSSSSSTTRSDRLTDQQVARLVALGAFDNKSSSSTSSSTLPFSSPPPPSSARPPSRSQVDEDAELARRLSQHPNLPRDFRSDATRRDEELARRIQQEAEDEELARRVAAGENISSIPAASRNRPVPPVPSSNGSSASLPYSSSLPSSFPPGTMAIPIGSPVPPGYGVVGFSPGAKRLFYVHVDLRATTPATITENGTEQYYVQLPRPTKNNWEFHLFSRALGAVVLTARHVRARHGVVEIFNPLSSVTFTTLTKDKNRRYTFRGFDGKDYYWLDDKLYDRWNGSIIAQRDHSRIQSVRSFEIESVAVPMTDLVFASFFAMLFLSH